MAISLFRSCQYNNICIKKKPILLKTYGYFHFSGPDFKSVKVGTWQAHLLDPVNTNLCAKKTYQRFPKISEVTSIFLVVTVRPRHCLRQEELTFANLFFWNLSVLLCVQSFTKYSMLKTYGDFHTFYILCFCVALSKKSGIYQA